MRKRLLALILSCGLLGLMGGPVAGASTTKGATSTVIAGAWQANPSLFVTGGDPQNCRVKSQAIATLHGALNGIWHEKDMSTSCDQSKLPLSLPYRNSGTGTFDGVFFGDQSQGSFTWKGTWTGDAISGQSIGVFDITSARGDPTWGCTTLRLAFDGYVNFATSVGGYHGTWIHGCKK